MENLKEPAWASKFDSELARNRRGFFVLFCAFVLVVSFFYGLVAGLTKQQQTAYAGLASLGVPSSETELPQRVRLPEGTEAVLVGEQTVLNNKAADVVSFFSNRPVKELVEEQIGIWQEMELTLSEKSSSRNAVIVGINRSTGERYSFSAWLVPPALRSAVSFGYAVQGMYAVADGSSVGGASAGEGEIPGIPIMPGGQGGAVFSSLEGTSRDFSGAYTNPASVPESMSYYRGALSKDGWRETAGKSGYEGEEGYGYLDFTRQGEEISLLFHEVPRDLSEENKTVVTVIRKPRKNVL